MHQQQFAGIGQIGLFADVLEQRQTNALFQLLDLHGDSRLGQEQRLRRPGKTAKTRNGLEDLQLTQTDMAQ